MKIGYLLCCDSETPGAYLECAWSEIRGGYALEINSCASGLCITSGTSMLYSENGEALTDGDSPGVCQDDE